VVVGLEITTRISVRRRFVSQKRWVALSDLAKTGGYGWDYMQRGNFLQRFGNWKQKRLSEAGAGPAGRTSNDPPPMTRSLSTKTLARKTQARPPPGGRWARWLSPPWPS